MMRNTLTTLLLFVLLTATAFAFRPQPILTRPQPQRRFASSTNTPLFAHEFDHLLHELDTPIRRTRRHVKIQLPNSQTTILASVTVAPSAVEETADALDQTSQGDDSREEYTPTTALDDDPFDTALPQQAKIQQYQQQQTLSNKLQSMDLQDLVLTLVLPSIALFAAARWSFNKVAKRVNDNTDQLLDKFSDEMIFHDGDLEEMNMCVKDYSARLLYLGPLKREKMLKRYLEVYAKRKTISPQAISSLSYVFTLFSLSEESAAQLLVSLCRELGPDKIASAGKLLFLGSRILKSPQGAQALQPIKDLIKSTYREATVAEAMVETSQQAMAEASYKSVVQNAGKKQKSLTPGWEVLGLDREIAERIFQEEAKEGFKTDRETMYGLQTQKYDKKGRRIDKSGKPENPEEADDNDGPDEAGGDQAVSNVYECSECGYTLFIAQGRESKFFGQGFKCPECGAPKDKFLARDHFDDDDEK